MEDSAWTQIASSQNTLWRILRGHKLLRKIFAGKSFIIIRSVRYCGILGGYRPRHYKVRSTHYHRKLFQSVLQYSFISCLLIINHRIFHSQQRKMPKIHEILVHIYFSHPHANTESAHGTVILETTIHSYITVYSMICPKEGSLRIPSFCHYSCLCWNS